MSGDAYVHVSASGPVNSVFLTVIIGNEVLHPLSACFTVAAPCSQLILKKYASWAALSVAVLYEVFGFESDSSWHPSSSSRHYWVRWRIQLWLDKSYVHITRLGTIFDILLICDTNLFNTILAIRGVSWASFHGAACNDSIPR